MSVKAMSWAFGLTDLSEGHKLLLLALADFADDNGICWPSQETLAVKCGVTDRTVRSRLKDLEAQNLLIRQPRYSKDRRGRTSDRIVLNLKLSSQEPKPDLPENPSGRNDIYRKAVSGEPSELLSGSKEGSSLETQTSLGNKPSLEGTQENESDSGTARPKVSIDGLSLTANEWEIAKITIELFNQQAGTNLSLISRKRATSHLRSIVCRIREYPDLTAEEHKEIIREAFVKPWWGKDKPKSVGVIYGPRAFPRCFQARTKNFSDERSVRDDLW